MVASRKLLKLLQNKAIQNFMVVAPIAVIQAANTIIVGRILEKKDFGLYNLIFVTTTQLFSSLLLFGQDFSIIRYFSSKDLYLYNWVSYLKKLFVFSFLPLIILTYIVKDIYNLTYVNAIYIILGSLLLGLTTIISSFLVSKKYFVTSSIILRLNPLLFFVSILSCMLIVRKINIHLVFDLKVLSFLIIIPVFFLLKTKWKNGKNLIDNSIYRSGFQLWLINLTVSLLGRMDAFIIPKVIGYESLATFSVGITLVMIYDFISVSFANIYRQRFANSEKVNYFKINIYLLLISSILMVFIVLFGDILLSFFFNNKYSLGKNLIFCFCLMGSLKVFHVLPSSYIIGKSDRLNRYLAHGMIGLLIKIFVLSFFFLINSKNLYGFLISTILAYIYRILVGYAFIKNDLDWRQNENIS